ncbi:MAG: 3-hydroxyacyl-CoA dehydrogenase family protein, partial [Gemmatimonadales bacterium]|nr:3-hydroxyacyl-CoA dehydrogenase family protein [Gemmatimonadales bacterium]
MITRVAIVGAGTMGHGIAAMASMAGYTVALTDSSEASRAAAHSKVERVVMRAIESGKLPSPPFASRAFRPSSIWAPGRRLTTNEQRKADALARVHVTETLTEAVDGADLVIEAIPERLELKQALFAELDDAAPAAALLATNTSSLSVTEIATAVGSPERVIGLHFFNPVAVMKLVELVRGAATSVHAIESATIFAESLGKTTILVRDSPGFATSRLGVVLGLEAIRMLE